MALQSSPVNADDPAAASQYNNLRADLITHTHDGNDTASLGAGSVNTTQLADASVTTAKIADDAVTADKLKDDASTDANRAVTTNHIRDSAVTSAKIASSAVTTAKIANDAVDDTKVGDRVPQFYRRQGGSSVDWSVAGATARTPGAVRMQGGVAGVFISNASAAVLDVAFPVAFSDAPIVLVSSQHSNFMASATLVTSSGFRITISDPQGLSWNDTIPIAWLAIGPE